VASLAFAFALSANQLLNPLELSRDGLDGCTYNVFVSELSLCQMELDPRVTA